MVRINAAEGAHVKLVQVQLLGNNVSRWGAVAIQQAAGSRVEKGRIELEYYGLDDLNALLDLLNQLHTK